MSERLHIIITGEGGRSSKFQLSKKGFFTTLSLTFICLTSICVFGYLTAGSYFTNKLLTRKVDDFQLNLSKSEQAGHDYRDQIAVIQDKYSTEMATIQNNHARQLATIQNNHARQLATIQNKHAGQVATIQDDHARLSADQQAQFDLENTNLQLENVRLMSTAVNDLNERSELIESVMDKIGVELKQGKKSSPDAANSGGPFIPAEKPSSDELLKQTGEYLEMLRQFPLGRPIPGSVSSRYGKRSDPMNRKRSIHEGVDIRGKKGDRIHVTADGTVLKAFKNGSYGNYVKVDHGNGYQTVYAHMQNYLVKKGEKIEQGQVVGQVGSSGRSTGPHLHYEILRNKKPIDPTRFMKVADISHTFASTKEQE